jgi:hypothetical protein
LVGYFAGAHREHIEVVQLILRRKILAWLQQVEASFHLVPEIVEMPHGGTIAVRARGLIDGVYVLIDR